MNQQLRVADILKAECVLSDLVARDKAGVLRELAALLERRGVIKSAEAAFRVLSEREQLGSTGIGDGVAIPHGKLPELDYVVAAFARSPEGVSFEAMDGEPVHLVFLLLAPENGANLHLKALARVARLMKSPDFRDELKVTDDPAALYDKILREDAGQ